MNSKIKKIMWIAISVLLTVGIIGIVLYASGSNHIQTKSQVIIQQDIDTVWEVIGNQFTEVHIWSSNFQDSQPGGVPKLSNIDYLHRATLTERGETLQELDLFAPDQYRLEYHISKGAPAIATKAYAKWYLQPLEEEKTAVILEFFIDTKGVKGRLFSQLIQRKIKATGDGMATELKYYLEIGTPHPNHQQPS